MSPKGHQSEPEVVLLLTSYRIEGMVSKRREPSFTSYGYRDSIIRLTTDRMAPKDKSLGLISEENFYD